MKKLSERRRAWLLRKSHRIMQRRTAHNFRTKRLREAVTIGEAHPRTAHNAAKATSAPPAFPVRIDVSGRHYKGFAHKRIPMARNLCFETNYEETAQCLQRVRELLREGEERQAAGKHISTLPSFMDFASITNCSPSAALVLAAEFDKSRAIRTFDIPLININKWDREFKRMLDDIGFFRLLNISRPHQASPRRSGEIMQFETGSMVGREEVAKITDKMIALLTAKFPGLEDDVDFQVTSMRVLSAIQEATENSCDHAYRDTTIEVVNRRWWATGSIDAANRHWNLVVYDQGNSIPKMLPHWDKYPYIASRFSRFERYVKRIVGPDEGDAIKMRLAMDAPRSSTDKQYRGKGFVLFRDVVEQSPDARILILSRNGKFLYRKGDKIQGEALKTPINGTLIVWDLWV